MKNGHICVLGGTGFVGGHLIAELVSRGWSVHVLTRQPEKHRDLRVLPDVELHACHIYDTRQLEYFFKGIDAVINLVGILHETRRHTFNRVHVELPSAIVHACLSAGVKRLLHISALNAALDAPSRYLRSKAEGEAAAMEGAEHGMAVTVFRPSVMFGPGDSFFNRFYRLLRLSPLLPLACASSKFAPVYVGDVALAICHAACNNKTAARVFELCGPQVFTLREIVDYIRHVTAIRRAVINLGGVLSWWQAQLLQWVPGKPFTPDNYRSLQVDSVCRGGFPSELGIAPHAIDEIVPLYLGSREYRARYADFRRLAGRSR